ncbi:MAG: NosD domain-containing protein, partial [Methanomicrobiaceae archaeon]|nr:NosD domain-containing protein [Methanomicrobiaceae archaeon]
LTVESAAVRITSLGSNTIIRNNRIEDSMYGIIATGSNGNIIHNNSINGTYYGVWLKYARNTLFANNTVTKNYHWALHNTYSTSTLNNYATSNRIEHNTFDTAGWTPFGYDDSYAREVLIDDTGGNTLSHNTFLNRTTIRITGDGNTVENNTVYGPSEYHFAGIHLSEDGNIVRNNTVENQKFGILLDERADNLQMSGNTISGCTYGFGFSGDLNYASSRPSRNRIDPTNTVNGAPIHWIVGETGKVYNYSTLAPAPGYLALIGCSDIRVEDFILEKNAQSVLIYRSWDVTLDSITAYGNAFQGFLLGDSSLITITGSRANLNGEDLVSNVRQAGIWATNTSRSRILDSNVTANNPTGIFFQYSCPDNFISGSTVTNNGHSSGTEGWGIRNSDSSNNNLTVTGCAIGNTFISRQAIGLVNYGGQSLFYDNRFFNHTEANAENYRSTTRWNVTPITRTNIIGGPWTAGNYWDDYTGPDVNSDGLGDTPYSTSGGMPGSDQHPLLDTYVPDATPPVITILSPLEGATYPAASVPLEVWSPDSDVAGWWYSLDGAANVTFTPNTTIPSPGPGAHTLQVWVSDSSGNENGTVVNFTAEADSDPPALFIISPVENATYTTRTVPLTVWSPDPDVLSWWYVLDNGTEVPFVPNTTITGIPNGNHTLVVAADDFARNENTSTVNFTVRASAPPAGGGGSDGGDSPPIFLPVVEPKFAIEILSPEPVRMTGRSCDLRFSAPVRLARAWYQLDGRVPVLVSPGTTVPIERLTLGSHTLRVQGVDYLGRYGEGSVQFEVIPLALGEVSEAGTDEFPDEASFGFNGKEGSYSLRFWADSAETVHVVVNRHLAASGDTVAWLPLNGQVETVTGPTGGWRAYAMTIPATLIVPETENIISFVHTENPARQEDPAPWMVRDVRLVSEFDGAAPAIEVFTPDQALGPGDELMAWVRISGVPSGEAYTAEVYLAAPDGRLLSFPGGGEPAPLDDRYVQDNHFGRLPGALQLGRADTAGTYRLVAALYPEGSGAPVSLSSLPVYYSSDPSLRLFTSRDLLTDGMPLRVACAVTTGGTAVNASIVTILEMPDGSSRYLPAGPSSGEIPLRTSFITLLEDTIGSDHPPGTYRISSVLYDMQGNDIASDTATFTVSRDTGTLVIRFPGGAAESRIRVTDALSLDSAAVRETGTSHQEVRIPVAPGTYWITGEAVSAGGEALLIPVDVRNLVSVPPGETVGVQLYTEDLLEVAP